jgi:glycosyltransferase involved in cell wall biosynthesis
VGKILIIIPAYNEQATIGKVLSAIRAEIPSYKILVINDGSFDDTASIAREMGAEVLDLPFNMGIGAALQTGYLYAQREGYDYVVRTDADGQHDVACIGHLLKPVMAGEADFVIGSRYLSTSQYQPTLARRIGMKILANFVSSIVREPITDTTSGFQAMNRNVTAFFARFYPDDYPEVESIVLLHKKGFRIKEVGVKMSQRSGGRSSITSLKSIYYMIKVILAICIEMGRRNES